MSQNKIVFALMLTALSAYTFAGGKGSGSVAVHGYVRKDGTYVPPHQRSAPDGNFGNNWSTEGNVNPYTGEDGKLTNPPTRSVNGAITSPSFLPAPSRPSDINQRPTSPPADALALPMNPNQLTAPVVVSPSSGAITRPVTSNSLWA
jgi:hypothetical protein